MFEDSLIKSGGRLKTKQGMDRTSRLPLQVMIVVVIDPDSADFHGSLA